MLSVLNCLIYIYFIYLLLILTSSPDKNIHISHENIDIIHENYCHQPSKILTFTNANTDITHENISITVEKET